MTLFLLGIVFLLVILHWATRGASPSNLGHREGGSGDMPARNMASVCICMANRAGAALVAVIIMILAVCEVLAAFAEHLLRHDGGQNAYLVAIELHAVLRAWSVTSWIDFLASLMLVYGVLNKHVNSLTMWIVFKCFLLSMSAVSTLYASFHQHSMTDGSSGAYRYRSDRYSSSDTSSDGSPSNGAWTGAYSYSTSPVNPVVERRENPFGIPFPLMTALLFPLQILCVYVVHKFRTDLLYQEQLRSFHASSAANADGGVNNAASQAGTNSGNIGHIPIAVQNFRFVPSGVFGYNTDEVSLPPRNDHPPAYEEIAKHDNLPTYLEAVLNSNNTGTTNAANVTPTAEQNVTAIAMPTADQGFRFVPVATTSGTSAYALSTEHNSVRDVIRETPLLVEPNSAISNAAVTAVDTDGNSAASPPAVSVSNLPHTV